MNGSDTDFLPDTAFKYLKLGMICNNKIQSKVIEAYQADFLLNIDIYAQHKIMEKSRIITINI